MTFEKTFIFSDAHGQFDTAMKALEHAGFDPEQGHRLIVNGDTMDRGPKSYEMFMWVWEMQEKYGSEQIVYLKGNHEQMLEDWLKGSPDGEIFLPNGGDATVHSFLGDEFAYMGQYPVELANGRIWWVFPKDQQEKARKEFLACFPDVLPYLESLPLILEEEDVIVVHAGLNPFNTEREEKDLLWIRELFWHEYRGKLVIFGHSPVFLMQNHNEHPWVGEDKIGIDGGAGVSEHGRIFVMEWPARHWTGVAVNPELFAPQVSDKKTERSPL